MQHNAVDASITISLQDLQISRCSEYADRKRRWISTSVLRQLAELRQHFEWVGTTADRHPAIAVGDCPLGPVRKAAANDDWWMRLLHRLRPLHHLVELDELAGVFRLGLCPDLFHRQDAFAHQLEARLKNRAMIDHLLGVPAAADAKDEAAGRQPVDGGHLLCGMDGIALDDEQMPVASL